MGLHGHTARMASYDSIDGAAELKRQLPSCRNHDYLDKDKAYGTPSTSRLAEPYASEGEGSDVVTEGTDAVTEGTDAVTVEQMAEVVAREWDLECRSGSDEGAEEQSAEEEEWVVVEAQGLAV